MSDWGFDFRPDYQRLTRTLLQLAPGTPGAGHHRDGQPTRHAGRGGPARRGDRHAARLIGPGLAPAGRGAWAQRSGGIRLGGGGAAFVAGLRHRLCADCRRDRAGGRLPCSSTAWTSRRIRVRPTNGEELEDRLRDNKIKALVATSALGMGYDKPDLAFCVHLGSPASPVAYYQQVGRAGRALEDAQAVLVPAESDERIWDFFATSGIPTSSRWSGSWTRWATRCRRCRR